MNYPSKLRNLLYDTIFPARCLGCREFDTGTPPSYLCPACLAKIKIRKVSDCIGCGKMTDFGATCPACSSDYYLDNLFSTTDYKDPVVISAVKTLKYRFVQDAQGGLNSLADRYIRWLARDKDYNIFADNPLLIPVPLHQKRLYWRGFNQAGLIANYLAAEYQMNWRKDVLIRINSAQPQADIENRDQRINNIDRQFFVAKPESIKGKPIMLIDDVATTGATLNECAKILKENGSGKVIGFTIARG